MFSTPVLLIIFNRPEVTLRVLESLRAIKPKVLYVAADGPRKNNSSDAILCAKTRSLIETEITWECEVKTLFQEVNLGCGRAVSGAITWFFKHNEYGIILEDDCLPNNSFYIFCEELLLKYKDKEQVMHIGGTNFQKGVLRGNGSYYFSAEIHVWGWASWKRAWDHYDFDIKELSAFIKKDQLSRYYDDEKIKKYWLRVFRRMEKHEIDTWDYQWRYSIWKNKGIAIIPQKNLVSNIGFGSSATHTTIAKNPFENMPTFNIPESLSHPDLIETDKEADLFTFNDHYKRQPRNYFSLLKRGYSKIKRFLR